MTTVSQSDADHRGLVKVQFVLASEDRAAGVEAENLWAQRTGRGSFKIDNIPFYAYGVSVGDIVAAEEVEGHLRFHAVLSRGGHSTYRVLVKSEEGYESDGFKALWISLERLGCSREVARSRVVAIDVPPSTDVFAVYQILEEGERQGVWSFEEAHCGHTVP